MCVGGCEDSAMVLKEKKPNEEPDAGVGRVYVGLPAGKFLHLRLCSITFHGRIRSSFIGYRTRLLDPLTHDPTAARFALGSVINTRWDMEKILTVLREMTPHAHPRPAPKHPQHAFIVKTLSLAL